MGWEVCDKLCFVSLFCAEVSTARRTKRKRTEGSFLSGLLPQGVFPFQASSPDGRRWTPSRRLSMHRREKFSGRLQTLFIVTNNENWHPLSFNRHKAGHKLEHDAKHHENDHEKEPVPEPELFKARLSLRLWNRAQSELTVLGFLALTIWLVNRAGLLEFGVQIGGHLRASPWFRRGAFGNT